MRSNEQVIAADRLACHFEIRRGVFPYAASAGASKWQHFDLVRISSTAFRSRGDFDFALAISQLGGDDDAPW